MTPEEIRDDLHERLVQQQIYYRSRNSYFEGDHPLPDSPRGARAEYLRLMRMARSNWCELIVEAVAERLEVVGVRFSEETEADLDVWSKLWQPNQLDARQHEVYTESLIGGQAAACVMVWPQDDELVPVRITPEHPEEVIVRHVPGSTKRQSALKFFEDGDDEFAFLFLGDGVRKWKRDKNASGWDQYSDDDDPGWPIPNPFPNGEIPVIPFPNKARMRGSGRSEIDRTVTDIQDRINETVFSRLMSQRFQSFRQKWITGIKIPRDPETNKPIEPYKAAIDRLWISEDPDAKFGDFDVADLTPIIRSVEADVQHLAAITRTPPHYLLGQSGAFPSGESLKSTETGLVAKVKKRQSSWSERWEEVIRLGLSQLEGMEDRASDLGSEIVWRDPESRSEGELVDSLVKMSTIGVPFEALWERYGASPQEISRWRSMRAGQDLLAPAPIEETAEPADEQPRPVEG